MGRSKQNNNARKKLFSLSNQIRRLVHQLGENEGKKEILENIQKLYNEMLDHIKEENSPHWFKDFLKDVNLPNILADENFVLKNQNSNTDHCQILETASSEEYSTNLSTEAVTVQLISESIATQDIHDPSHHSDTYFDFLDFCADFTGSENNMNESTATSSQENIFLDPGTGNSDAINFEIPEMENCEESTSHHPESLNNDTGEQSNENSDLGPEVLVFETLSNQMGQGSDSTGLFHRPCNFTDTTTDLNSDSRNLQQSEDNSSMESFAESTSFDVTIPASDWLKMEFINDENDLGKLAFNNKSYVDILSRHVRAVTGGSSILANYCRKNNLKSRKNNTAMISGTFRCVFASSASRCKVTYKASVHRDQPFITGPVTWNFQQVGNCFHPCSEIVSRPLCGSSRIQLKRECANIPPAKSYNDRLIKFEHSSKDGDLTDIYSKHTFSQLKSEVRRERHIGATLFDGLRKSQKILIEKYCSQYENENRAYKIEGGLFEIDENKNQVIITSQKQISLIPTKNPIFHIDLTGQLCSNICGKKILLTTVLVVLEVKGNGPKTLMPVIQRFSSENKAYDLVKLIILLNEFFKKLHPTINLNPIIINIDAAWELIFGLVRVYGPGPMVNDKSGNLPEYLDLSYRIVNGQATEDEIKKFINIHICYAHHMKNICDRLSKELRSVKYGEKKKVKNFIKDAYYKIPNATVYDDLKEIFENLCIVCDSEKLLEQTTKKAIKFFEDSDITFKEDEIKLLCMKDVEDTELLETEENKNIILNNKFTKDLEKIREKVKKDLESRQKRKYYKNAEPNPYFLPTFIDYFLKYKAAFISMFSGLLFEKERYLSSTKTPSNTIRSSQARMEAYHSEYKRANKDGKTPDLEIATQTLIDHNRAKVIHHNIHTSRVPNSRKAAREEISPSKKSKTAKNSKSEAIPDINEANAEWCRRLRQPPELKFKGCKNGTTETPKKQTAANSNLNKADNMKNEPVVLGRINQNLKQEFEGDFLHQPVNIGKFVFTKEEYDSMHKDYRFAHRVLGDDCIDPFTCIMCKWANTCYGSHIIGFIPLELACRLLDGDPQYIPQGIIKWIADESLQSRKIWILPYHVGYHFIFFFVDFRNKEITCIDAKHPEISPNMDEYTHYRVDKIIHLIALCNMENGERCWVLNLSCVKLQQDGISCGLYLSYWIYLLCTGCTSEMEVSDYFLQTQFRITMRKIFINYIIESKALEKEAIYPASEWTSYNKLDRVKTSGLTDKRPKFILNHYTTYTSLIKLIKETIFKQKEFNPIV